MDLLNGHRFTLQGLTADTANASLIHAQEDETLVWAVTDGDGRDGKLHINPARAGSIAIFDADDSRSRCLGRQGCFAVPANTSSNRIRNRIHG